ncbi:Mur ligase family protein [Campylobacter mucosalis]|uniref:Mur ligase family protein n=1 Tax=Campylobacter mucosalis TaxID=202 RepID=UPI0014707B62|nr:Mur ligase family protein [Campylobacter mucosalis]
MRLDEFLSSKPLFYKEIDYSRMPRAYESIKGHLKPFKIVHIIGTNGKGSTGRFLAQILHLNGKSVGHYTSPHIFDFRERFWLNDDVVGDELLELAHQKLLEILPDEFKVKTSYFEYATLLAAVLFSQCDYFICEAGMGGEYDATNVFDKILSLFTPIGFDHTAVLGDSLEKISSTKFKAMSKNVILNDNMNEISAKIAKDLAVYYGSNLHFSYEILNQNDRQAIQDYAKRQNLPDFLISNFTLAYSGAKFLLNDVDIKNLSSLRLRGRCEQISPNLYVDVGHNELGAMVVAKHFNGKKLRLIFNSFADKDFKAVLKTLKPIIKDVLIFEYESSERELGGAGLHLALSELGFEFRKFDQNDLEIIKLQKDSELYLVFGSFYLVEAFLKAYQGVV